MKQFEQIAARGQIVPFLFCQDAVAASQTDAQLNIVEVASAAALAVDGITMPWAGRVVGLSVDLSAAATAGQLTVGVTIGGTEQAATTQTITTAQAARAVFSQNAVPFVAGDKLGVEITTNAGWDATTADLAVFVYVLLDCQGV
jgi:GH18 family chitinase